MLRISAVIPAYNAAATIGGAIRSVLSQTLPCHELIVVDDGSADDTSAVVRTFGERVRLIQQPNGGPASARNRGIRLAKGEWIGLLDADDEWTPQKNEVQAPCTQAEDVGLVCARAGHVDLALRSLWARNKIINSSVLLRRAAFDSVAGFDEDRSLIGVEDYNLWLRLTAAGWRAVHCPETLVRYGPTASSLTRQVERFARAELVNVRKMAELPLPGLTKADFREKASHVLLEYGRELFYLRQLKPARGLLLQAMRARPRPSTCVLILASLLPPRVLDLRRRRSDRGPAAAHIPG